jgi:hypothetical protein
MENLFNNSDVIQIVFTKTAKSNNGLWVMNRVGSEERWNLMNLKVNSDHQYAILSTEKAIRVAAKHMVGLVPNAFTRDDFKRDN